MGDVTVAAFAALGALGIALLGFGLFNRRRGAALLGGSLLVSLAAIWIFGPLGIFCGLLVFWFPKRRQ